MKEPSDTDELRNRSYPVQEDMRIQRHYWRVERIGGWILLVVVGLTLLGLFSKGLLSTTTAHGPGDALQVEYERFMRNGATTTLIIDASGMPGSPRRIDITGQMLEGATLESVQPQPQAASTVEGNGISLQAMPDHGGHIRLHLALRADGVGFYRSRIEIDDHAIDLWQFIYP